MNQEQMKTSPGSFLFRGTLVVPKWSEFWWRYLILLCLGVAALDLALWTPAWAFHWSESNGTVTTLGIALHFKEAPLQLQQTARDVYADTVVAFYALYVLSVVVVYGPRRFWQEIIPASWKRVAGYIVVISAVLILGSYLSEWCGSYSGDPHGAKSKSWILLAGVAGPITEELFARLTLYQMLRSKFRFLIAAVVSSLIFGLLHFGYPEPIKMIMGTLVGAFLCWTYEKTGSILTPIGIHVLNNLWNLL